MTTWQEARGRLGRNDLPEALFQNYLDMAPEEVAKGWEDAWTGCEWPLQAADPDVWMAFFEAAGGVPGEDFLDEAVMKPVADLEADRFVLYRGGIDPRGMSWTDNLDTAQWFARRFSPDPRQPAEARARSRFQTGKVWEVEVGREEIIGRFQASRGEREYVLDPYFLDLAEDEMFTERPEVEAWEG